MTDMTDERHLLMTARRLFRRQYPHAANIQMYSVYPEQVLVQGYAGRTLVNEFYPRGVCEKICEGGDNDATASA